MSEKKMIKYDKYKKKTLSTYWNNFSITPKNSFDSQNLLKKMLRKIQSFFGFKRYLIFFTRLLFIILKYNKLVSSSLLKTKYLSEDDKPKPLNIYAKTKLDGETNI